MVPVKVAGSGGDVKMGVKPDDTFCPKLKAPTEPAQAAVWDAHPPTVKANASVSAKNGGFSHNTSPPPFPEETRENPHPPLSALLARPHSIHPAPTPGSDGCVSCFTPPHPSHTPPQV